MAKYDPLSDHLARRGEPVVEMAFADVDRLVGGLPPSARKYPAWWANDEASGTHSHAGAWLDIGRRTTRLDLKASARPVVTLTGELRDRLADARATKAAIGRSATPLVDIDPEPPPGLSAHRSRR